MVCGLTASATRRCGESGTRMGSLATATGWCLRLKTSGWPCLSPSRARGSREQTWTRRGNVSRATHAALPLRRRVVSGSFPVGLSTVPSAAARSARSRVGDGGKSSSGIYAGRGTATAPRDCTHARMYRADVLENSVWRVVWELISDPEHIMLQYDQNMEHKRRQIRGNPRQGGARPPRKTREVKAEALGLPRPRRRSRH